MEYESEQAASVQLNIVCKILQSSLCQFQTIPLKTARKLTWNLQLENLWESGLSNNEQKCRWPYRFHILRGIPSSFEACTGMNRAD